MLQGDRLRQRRSIVAAQEAAAVGIDADAEVADTDLQARAPDNICDCGDHARIYLCRVEGGCVALIVEGDEVDVGDAW